jgi:hypothetical protein
MGRLVGRRHIGGSAPDEIGGPDAPEPFNFTRDVIEARAADTQRRALRFVDAQGVIDKRTFDDVAGAAARWAALLRSRELTPGDRVVVLLEASPTWPAVLLGALKAGIVVVPCEREIPNDDLELRLRHADARLLVVDGERAASLPELDAVVQVLVCEDAASELRGLGGAQPTHDTTVDDPAIVISPADAAKGLLSHGGTRGALELVEHGLDVRPDDLVWCAAETGSSTWLWNGLLVPWAAGASTVIHDADFDPQQRLELIQRLGVTVLRQRPDEYRQLVDQPVQHGALDGLRRAVSVGGPVDPDVADAFRALSGVTVEEELEDGMLTEESGAPEPHAVASNGVLEALSDRGSIVPADGQPAPLAAVAAVAAPREDPITRDEAAAAEARRLDDERRDAERKAAAARADAEALERKLQEAAAADAARAAAEKAKAEERECRQREKDAAREAELAERRAEEERRAAAARAQADARERKRQEAAAAEAAKRAAAEERRAAEASAKADERDRKQREKDAAREAKLAERRAKEVRKAAAAQAEADARERKRQEAAAAEAAKRAAAEGRRTAEAKAKEDERLRKQQEREAAAQARRAEDERRAAAARGEADARERKRREAAAAEAAKHTEEKERRAAAAKVKDDDRRRTRQENQAAEQARRDEEERRAAARQTEADRRAAEKAEQRRLAGGAREEAERQPREERPLREEPVAVPAGNGNPEPDAGEGRNQGLMERLSAYTHHTDAATEDPPPQ